ncbi:acyl-CoA synthetase [Enemella evansiae]|uniref:acyl-CoA synthetase n=1 Tax=Enemella evansiae TaxID=2016499 RepID=UPI00105E5155|nr:long-chain fatty acid--CoA ligase [Enemella evansiae]TDO91914.1 fatty-acyl-CoA synthase [Enemella evansiae]
MITPSISQWPARQAGRNPAATATVFGGQRRSYAEFDTDIARAAAALRARGIGPGDRVALFSANHTAHLDLFFACGRLGAILVPLNARLSENEVAHCLTDSGSTLLVASAALAGTGWAAAGSIPTVELDDWVAESAATTPETGEPVGTGDDPCMIMYTSGTTGRPKGAVLTHASVTFATLNAALDLDLTEREISLATAPLYHTAAFFMGATPTLLRGGTVIIQDGFEPGRVLAQIEADRISYGFGVPVMLDMLSRHPDWDRTDLTSLRVFTVGGAPVRLDTLHTWLARDVAVCQGYGLTESGPGALVLTPEQAKDKVGSAGLPHLFTEVRIAGLDDAPVTPGERGEIQVRGPNVMAGYWNNPGATAAAFAPDGWLRTGDVGVADDDGFITVVDRLKDMFISGGENVYPAEVEAAIIELPGVLEAAVLGVPDERWGETGLALIRLADGAELTAEALADQLAGRLARYKIPRRLQIVDSIPRNPTGKILKSRIRTTLEVDQ